MSNATGAVQQGPAPHQSRSETILAVDNLRVTFGTRDGAIHAVNGVSFALKEGELLGVVGESGSGKSVTMMALMRLLPEPPARIEADAIRFEGRDLTKATLKELRAVRGARAGFIFQDPMTSLNPVLTVGFQLTEPLRKHLGMGRKAARARATELLGLVGIPSPESRLDDFPHQFSGGMRQRVMIAMGLACEPRLLIADEPTTALDVTIQAQILEVVKEIRERLGTAAIWITHDLGVVAGIADRVVVMYAGQIVEEAGVDALFADPSHPYTAALLETLPVHGAARREQLNTIGGQPPVLTAPPAACPFAPRCAKAFAKCHAGNPPLFEIGAGHRAACWLHEGGAA